MTEAPWSDSAPTRASLRRVLGLLARVALDSGSTGAIQVGLAVIRNSRTVLQALLLREVVDAIAAGSGATAVRWGALVVAVLVVEGFASIIAGPASWIYIIQARLWVDRHLIDANAESGGIQHLEHPAWRDALTNTLERRWMFGDATWDVLELICVTIALAFSLFALAPIHPLLIVVVLATGFVNIGQVRAQQRNIKFWTQTLPEQRRADRLLRTVIRPEGAPELRVLGASDELANRHRTGYEAALEVDRDRERKQIALSVPTSLGEVVALGFGLWLVVNQLRRGEASPGDIALVLMLLQTTTEQLHNVWFTGAWLLQEVDAVSRLASLLDYRSPVRSKESPVPAAGLPKKGIRFEDVTFRYPDTEKDVLSGLTLELPAGSVVALVGDNGAGKSTIIKLLARLYDPTSGRVTVDGIDLRDLDLEQWRDGFTAAFQDFARFELRAAETVGVGDLDAVDDRDAIELAIREGAAQPVVDRLTDGLDAQLGRRWKGGTELSAGQWQKLAIARSRMRAEPRVLVLDEPTAALDPMAEAEIFERFALMTRAARREGGVALIVSHRFSTVRRADLIAVLGDGRLVEFGSHEELVAAQGTYAELWAIQAANYGR